MAERSRSTQTATKEAARRLAASGVEAVALAIVINSGVTLVKTIPLRRFEEAVKFGIGLSPVFTVFQVDDLQLQRISKRALMSNSKCLHHLLFQLNFPNLKRKSRSVTSAPRRHRVQK